MSWKLLETDTLLFDISISESLMLDLSTDIVYLLTWKEKDHYHNKTVSIPLGTLSALRLLLEGETIESSIRQSLLENQKDRIKLLESKLLKIQEELNTIKKESK